MKVTREFSRLLGAMGKIKTFVLITALVALPLSGIAYADTATVAGTITNQSGTQLNNVFVAAYVAGTDTNPVRVNSNSSGFYSMTLTQGVAYDLYFVWIFSSNTQYTETNVLVTGDMTFNVQMQPQVGHTFSGTVTDTQDQPVAGVEIRLGPVFGLAPSVLATSDPSGNFSVTVPVDTVYKVTSYKDTFVVDFRKLYDFTESNVTQNLNSFERVSFKVIAKDSSGQPIVNQQVVIAGTFQYEIIDGVTVTGCTGAPPSPSNPCALGPFTDVNGEVTVSVPNNTVLPPHGLHAPPPPWPGLCMIIYGGTPRTAQSFFCKTTETAINGATTTVLQDLTPPVAPNDLSAASPTQQPVLTWTATSGATSYDVYRNSSIIGNTITPGFTDTAAPEGNNDYYVVAKNDLGSSAPSNQITVLVDRTVPTVDSVSWTVNPVQVGSDSTVNAVVSDNPSGSGISGGEYFVGNDPGAGNGTPMGLNGGTLSATFGASLGVGVYNVGVRARDGAGNWSTTTPTMLVVHDPTVTFGVTGKNKKDLVPNILNGDILPGLLSPGQTDAADYGFAVDFKNGAIDPNSDFQFTYSTGTHCNTPHPNNCHSFVMNATSFDWLVIDAPNSQGKFQGTATVTADGVTTTNLFTVEVTDGDGLTPATLDHLTLKVFAPGQDAFSTPLYYVSEPVASGNSVVIK